MIFNDVIESQFSGFLSLGIFNNLICFLANYQCDFNAAVQSMIRLLFIPIGLIVFASAGQLVAQQADHRFHHLTIEQGLSQSTVQAIAQDSKGFLWFGTQEGLNRYDGYDFAIYMPVSGDTTSLGHEDIRVIYEDSRGDLWIGTQAGGLNRYDPDRDRFVRYIGEADAWRTLSSNTVWSILEDSDGNFWVGTYHGLNLLDRDNGTVRRIFADEDTTSLQSNQITALFEDSMGTVWVGTASGLHRLDAGGGADEMRFTRVESVQLPRLSDSFVRVIYEDRFGELWVGTEECGLFRSLPGEEEFHSYIHDPLDPGSLNDNTIQAIREDASGRLWVGSGNLGLNLFDRRTGQFTHIAADRQNPLSINSNGINSLFLGNDGIFWIGTFTGGVNFLDPGADRIRHYESSPVDPLGLSHNSVRAFLQDRSGRIWVGTDGGGLNEFDPETGRFRHLRHDPAGQNSISSDVVLALHENEDGIWVGTYNGGVDLFDPEREHFHNFRHVPDDRESISSNHVYSIAETADGDLWFGTNRGGFSRLDPASQRFERFMANPDDPEDPSTINNDDVRAIYEDSRGDLWFGTYANRNLARYDREGGTFTFFDLNEGQQYFSSVVQAVHEDRAGRLWLATRGGGLMRFDRESGEAHALTVDEGLPGNMIHAVVEDDHGALWLSTNNGIARFDPVDGSIRSFHPGHGLQSREFNPRAAYRDRDGFIYFGGVNGFNRFHPDSVRVDSLVPPVVLTDFQIFNRPVGIGGESPLQTHISRAERIVLPHDAYVITIGYSMLDFSATKGNRFAYILEGFDEQWNEVGERRRATYTNLAPGEYTFRVRAANRDGIWDETGSSLTLVITPPFWRTGWFYALLALFVIGMVMTVIQLRVRAIRRQNRKLGRLVADQTEELRKANETKDRLFSILAHDLNNVAAGLLGLSELLRQSVEEQNREETLEYSGYIHQASSQLANMLRNLLEWARSQTGMIEYRPRSFRLADRVEEVIGQEKGRAVNKQIALVSSVDTGLNVFGDPDMISVVLRNLVHNALKFTEPGGRVEVDANRSNGEVEILVKDSGVGMDEETVRRIFSEREQISTRGTAEERGTGLGLALCREFIAVNNGTIRAESKVGEGTTISFTIPENVSKTADEGTAESGVLAGRAK